MYGRYLFITPLCIIHLFKNVWQLGAPCFITPRMARARWGRPLAPPVTWRGGCRRPAGLTPDLPRPQPKPTPTPRRPEQGGCAGWARRWSWWFKGMARTCWVPMLRGAGWRCRRLSSPLPDMAFGVGDGDVPCLPPDWSLQWSWLADRCLSPIQGQSGQHAAAVQGGWRGLA